MTSKQVAATAAADDIEREVISIPDLATYFRASTRAIRGAMVRYDIPVLHRAGADDVVQVSLLEEQMGLVPLEKIGR